MVKQEVLERIVDDFQGKAEENQTMKILLEKMNTGELFYYKGIIFKRFRNGKVKEYGTVNEPNGYKYLQAKVNKKRYQMVAHKLIWSYFKGDIPKGMQINHINGVKEDNRIENLELVTPSENMIHSYKTNLASAKGERNSRSKLTIEQVKEIRKLKGKMLSEEVARKYNMAATTICRIWRNELWNDENRESDIEEKVISLTERIQNKADYFHRKAEYYFLDGDRELAAEIDANSHVYELCAMELKQALK